MDTISLLMIAAGMLAYALLSGRLRGSVVTGPMVFVAFGFIIGGGGFGLAQIDPGHAAIHFIAECTLILVLFADAARIKLDRLRRDHNLPLRMLAFGLPLSMLLGTLFAAWMFAWLSFWEAALLAALLAPTDAALGQSVVSEKAVPVRIRQAINIESGLNDGIALPVVLLLAALAGMSQQGVSAGEWLGFGFLQVTLGPLFGAAAGVIGAGLLDTSVERGRMDVSFQGIGILALAVLAYAGAELVGGNGFIAVFVAGMLFGHRINHPCTFLFEFMETEGQLLMLITFLVFGAVLLPEALAHATPAMFVYSLLSLSLIRILPIALALLGTGVRLPTQLFLGWFGPRGLASILFLLLILEDSQVSHKQEILTITVLTVGLSVLLHGLSAAPLARRYGQLAQNMGQCQENVTTVSLPLREGLVNNENNRTEL